MFSGNTTASGATASSSHHQHQPLRGQQIPRAISRHQTAGRQRAARWLDSRSGALPLGEHLPALLATGSHATRRPRVALYTLESSPSAARAPASASASSASHSSGASGASGASASDELRLLSSAPHSGHVEQLRWLHANEDHPLLVTASSRGHYALYSASVDDADRSAGGGVRLGAVRVFAEAHRHGAATAVDVLADGSRLCGGGEDGALVTFDATRDHLLGTPIRAHSQTVRCALFLGRDRVATAAASLRIWDLRAPAAPPLVLKDVDRNGALVCSAAIHPDRPHQLATASSDGTLLVWDLRGRQYPVFRAQQHRVCRRVCTRLSLTL
jgi:WD40 repeat protein